MLFSPATTEIDKGLLKNISKPIAYFTGDNDAFREDVKASFESSCCPRLFASYNNVGHMFPSDVATGNGQGIPILESLLNIQVADPQLQLLLEGLAPLGSNPEIQARGFRENIVGANNLVYDFILKCIGDANARQRLESRQADEENMLEYIYDAA